ncbi:1121_t:CDS:1 [Paraglomus brasilianum]|uniref:1121_t:CDS:1 n=1 Tax=Paraglomus brasilianum TaxID=144538 RepID=A0A9N9EYU8_9GLOM|nr:1121_t:CDS:1 [Paraglomus brasilianum]
MTTVNPDMKAWFLDETRVIDQRIAEIQTNITRINELQTNILTGTSSQQEATNARERESIMTHTKSILFEIKDKIKAIERENARLPRDHPELNLRRQRHAHLREKFTNVLEEYRGIEEGYRQKQKERMARQYRVANPDATQTEIDSYLNNTSNQPIFATSLVRTSDARTALAEVQKRHDDIKQIEQTIGELADLFNEMQLLVEAQDDVLVNIEENVDETLMKTEQANEHLTTATMSALAARKKKWICLGISLLVAIIVIAILVVYLHPKNIIPSNSGNTSNTVTVVNTVTPTPTTRPT